MHWIEILKNIAPLALAFTPAAPFIPALIAGIELAEARGGSSVEKKALAVETAVKIAQGVEAVKAGTVDPQSLGEVVSNGIETAVGVANLIHKGPEEVKVVPVAVAEAAVPAAVVAAAVTDTPPEPDAPSA